MPCRKVGCCANAIPHGKITLAMNPEAMKRNTRKDVISLRVVDAGE